MLGHRLITKQTPPEGLPANLVLVARREFIRREVYFAILLDRESACPVIVGSAQGGMNIEDVARDNPAAIKRLYLPVETVINGGVGIDRQQLVDMAVFLRLHGQKRIDEAVDIMEKLYKMFIQTDCMLFPFLIFFYFKKKLTKKNYNSNTFHFDFEFQAHNVKSI